MVQPVPHTLLAVGSALPVPQSWLLVLRSTWGTWHARSSPPTTTTTTRRKNQDRRHACLHVWAWSHTMTSSATSGTCVFLLRNYFVFFLSFFFFFFTGCGEGKMDNSWLAIHSVIIICINVQDNCHPSIAPFWLYLVGLLVDYTNQPALAHDENEDLIGLCDPSACPSWRNLIPSLELSWVWYQSGFAAWSAYQTSTPALLKLFS